MASNPYANLQKMLHAITLLSQPAGTTINSLMEHIRVSRRTAFRLLEAIDELGFPVVNERAEFGGEKTYRLIETFVQRLPNISLPGVAFTPREAFYIRSMIADAHASPDVNAEPILASLQSKLDLLIREATRASTGEAQSYATHSQSDKDLGPMLGSIKAAIRDHRACAIRYRNFEPPGSRLYVIHPLRLIQDSGAFFLFAGLPRHEGIRLLPVDRLASLEVLDNTFTTNLEAELDSLIAHSLDLSDSVPVPVVVHVAPNQVASIQELHLGPFQKVVTNPDGSSTITVTTTVPDDLLRYILSLGSGVEIITPPALRQKAEDQLAATLARYRSPSRH
jgi:predicted DNA-binding transcriptional regulator YafY